MAKYVIVFIIVAMILPASFLMGGEEKKRPFRNVEWGMTMKEVRKAEQKAELVKETKEKNKRLSEMTYKTKLNNTSFLLRYYFADDKLYSASYICDDNFEDSNRYVEEYYAFNSQLTKLYGTPETDNTIWEIDLYKNDKSMLGRAYALGHVMSYGNWRNIDGNIIIAQISGKKGETELVLSYSSDYHELPIEAGIADGVLKVTADGEIVEITANDNDGDL